MKQFIFGAALLAASFMPAFSQSNVDDMSPGELMIQVGIMCSQSIQDSDYSLTKVQECTEASGNIEAVLKDSSTSSTDRNLGVLGAMINYQTIGTAQMSNGLKSQGCSSFQKALNLRGYYTKGVASAYDESFDKLVSSTQEFSTDSGC